MKPPALRVRIRGRYVLRPSGKYRHKVKLYLPAEGQQNGAGESSPLRFLLRGRCAYTIKNRQFISSTNGYLG